MSILKKKVPVVQDGTDATYETRRKTRRIRLMIMLIVLVLLLTIGITVSSVILYTDRIKQERIHMAEGITKLAASFIDAGQVETYLSEGEKTPGYYQTKNELYRIKENAFGIEYLYVLQVKEDGCHFIFDLDTDDTDGVPVYKPGDVVGFEEAFKPYVPELLSGRKIKPIESNDVSGWVLTIYSPHYDSNGNCVCYIGADVSMTDVREDVYHFVIQVGLVAAMFLILILVVAANLSYHYRKVTDWEALMKKQEQSKQLVREIVTAFSKTVDMKDKYTNGHSFRVAKYTAMLTRELGYDEETVEKYYNIALLHDIGKIGVPEEVLNKPGKLTDEEFDIIKSHTVLGNSALKDIGIMPDLAQGAGAHHERPDGKGYPNGLKGDEIPRVAQIIAVADTFDAMYSNRPYRKRMNFEKAVSIIKEASGTQLTSDVVEAFLHLVEKGAFRAADDNGGGSMEDINNIRKHYNNSET